MALKKWLLATVLLGSSPVYAICGALCPSYGFYVMGNFGATSIQYNKQLLDQSLGFNPPSNTVTSNTRNSYGAGLGLGYKFNDYFALESAYDYFWTSQETKLATTNSQTQEPLNIHINQKNTRAAVLFARDILPISPLFGLYAKGGGAYSWTTLSMSGTEFNTINRSKNNWEWAYGAGLDYQIARHVALFADWTRINGRKSYAQLSAETAAPNITINTPKINFYSVGLRVLFG